MSTSIQIFEPLPEPPASLPADFVERFWRKDPTLWPGGEANDVAGMLGWIDVLDKIESRFEEIDSLVASVKAEGFKRVVLCGMGGSSLAPLVLAESFGTQPDGLPLHVLDSTHPDAIQQVLDSGLEGTLFIIASKSGSTAEPTAFDRFFFEQAKNPAAFVAITDPNSPFEASAKERQFRHIFLNYADIGGRFSALSLFGLVPAALLGIDIRQFVAVAKDYAINLQAGVSDVYELGTALGAYALAGRDKLTIHTSPNLATFGLWLEQLVAESTGKHGKGILPIAGERPGEADVYGQDRFFVGIGTAVPGSPSFATDLESPYEIASEFLRWEVVTAIAGSVIGINPFDQPNVQESKDVTKRILAEVESTGTLGSSDREVPPSRDELHRFLADVKPGDYISLQAYLGETPAITEMLADLQAALRDQYRVPVTVGYGPRFLHSTGQFHKGGPNTGWFVQLVDQSDSTLSIPGQKANWATFVRAQARGDFEALAEKGRRIICFDLGTNPQEGLATLQS